jgi:outer membrane protein assembly factor BamB
VGGVLYVELSNMILYALDPATGALIWEVSTGILKYNRTPSVAVAGGAVYVGSNGDAQAYSAADGTQLWSTSITDGHGQSPSVANGVVYTPGGVEGSFWALDASTGDPLWSFTAGNLVGGGSDMIANGRVYVGSADGNLYAFALPSGT